MMSVEDKARQRKYSAIGTFDIPIIDHDSKCQDNLQYFHSERKSLKAFHLGIKNWMTVKAAQVAEKTKLSPGKSDTSSYHPPFRYIRRRRKKTSRKDSTKSKCN